MATELSKICIANRPGWQPLPDMVDSCSLSVSNQQRKKGDFTEQVLLTQQSWHEDFQKRLNLFLLYERSISQDSIHIMKWWLSEEPWKKISDTEKVDDKAFVQKAENLKRAINVYNYLLSEHGNLEGHIIELQEVANGIDKVHKGVRIAGITGGAAGAAGVAAAVGGVILAPVTMGGSKGAPAVGFVVAAAGGSTGASAAITNKVHTNMDRKKVETILKDHSTQMEEIEKCVKVIGSNVEYLKKYNLSTMRGVDWQAVKVARMAHKLGDSVGAMGALSKSSGLIQGFTLGLDMYFNKEDCEQLKKGSETKFAKSIRKVAKQMQTTLDELMKLKSVVESDI